MRRLDKIKLDDLKVELVDDLKFVSMSDLKGVRKSLIAFEQKACLGFAQSEFAFAAQAVSLRISHNARSWSG